LYVPPTKVKQYEHAPFTPEDVETFNSFYHQDVAIYNHFNKTFWQRVETYGRDKMKKDVEHLKEIYKQCAEKTIDCSHKGHE
jgi:hypothetical protein